MHHYAIAPDRVTHSAEDFHSHGLHELLALCPPATPLESPQGLAS